MKFIKFAMPAIALFAIASQAHADSLDYSLTITGLTNAPGITVSSFSIGVSNPAAANAQTYSGKKGIFSNLNISREADGFTGALSQACFQGTQFASIELKGVDPNTQQTVLNIVMTRCFVSGVQLSGANGGGSPFESISISGTRLSVNGVQINPANLASVQKANAMIAKLIKKHDAARTTIK